MTKFNTTLNTTVTFNPTVKITFNSYVHPPLISVSTLFPLMFNLRRYSSLPNNNLETQINILLNDRTFISNAFKIHFASHDAPVKLLLLLLNCHVTSDLLLAFKSDFPDFYSFLFNLAKLRVESENKVKSETNENNLKSETNHVKSDLSNHEINQDESQNYDLLITESINNQADEPLFPFDEHPLLDPVVEDVNQIDDYINKTTKLDKKNQVILARHLHSLAKFSIKFKLSFPTVLPPFANPNLSTHELISLPQFSPLSLTTLASLSLIVESIRRHCTKVNLDFTDLAKNPLNFINDCSFDLLQINHILKINLINFNKKKSHKKSFYKNGAFINPNDNNVHLVPDSKTTVDDLKNVQDVEKLLKSFKQYKGNFKKNFISKLVYKKINNENFNPYFCTFDLETFKNKEGIATPYLFSCYVPNVGFNAFYGLNCVEKALDFILNHNYPEHQKIISYYAHFAGGFDTLLLMQHLINLNIKLEYLQDKHNNIFYLKFIHNDRTFELKDSFRLIPLSLNKILTGFNIKVNEHQIGKLPFDHSWVSEESLNYTGEIPNWLLDHKDLLTSIGVVVNNIFNFEKYSIAYNQVDTIGLHKGIEKFFRILVAEFKIDFTDCLTLPQLAMRLFRMKFFDDKKDKIKHLSRKMQNLFSKAYYGANTSVYKPYGENLYYYDINSLYPYCMLKDMPVDTPKKYNVQKGLADLFGFALVKVSVPEDLNITLLPLYVQIDNTTKLVYPTGTFKGYYFSEELKAAQNLGCQIQLIEAWEFKRSDTVFNSYIEAIYKLKETGNKDERDVFKLLLNSLYGKFGQIREHLMNIITDDPKTMKLIEQKYSNIKVTSFKEGTVGYSFDKAPNPYLLEDSPELFNLLKDQYEIAIENRPTNMAIAAAITAYARIEIDKYKRLPDTELYYSDTDCVVISKPLPKEFVGKAIGQMKNEVGAKDPNYTVENDSNFFLEKGIFLRDKLYTIKPCNGKAITKFSGLHKDYVTPELHKTIEDIYLNNGKNLTLKTEVTSRNMKTFEIMNNVVTEKNFVFNYNKRIQVLDEKGIWIDTKPINITSVRHQNKDLNNTVVRSRRKEDLSQKKGIKITHDPINIGNLVNQDYKIFDGNFLNYFLPIFGAKFSDSYTIPKDFNDTSTDPFINSKTKLLRSLEMMVDKAMEEKILVPGIGYLISEEYITRQGVRQLNTVGYLESFMDKDTILQEYGSHLDGIREGGNDSGHMLTIEDKNANKQGSYTVRTLYLRIRIREDLIKDKNLLEGVKFPVDNTSVLDTVEKPLANNLKENLKHQSQTKNFKKTEYKKLKIIKNAKK
jgi:hypothetical protein